MEVEKFEKHVYELDLKEVLNNYKTGIHNVELKYPDKTPEYLIGLIRSSIKFYCDYKGIKFKEDQQILVNPEDDGSYRYFLALSLMFLDNHLIRQYLNFHEKLFQSQSKSGDSFIDVVEFILTHIIKYSSPIDNSKRLYEIMLWVENKRSPSPKKNLVKNKRGIGLSLPLNTLEWKGPELALILVSEELYKSKYIDLKLDFFDACKGRKKINWRGKIQPWVYCMSVLANEPYAYITTSAGKKPYFRIGQDFFNFCDENQTRVKKMKPSTILYNITKRSIEKYASMRSEIDLLFKSVFDSQKAIISIK